MRKSFILQFGSGGSHRNKGQATIDGRLAGKDSNFPYRMTRSHTRPKMVRILIGFIKTRSNVRLLRQSLRLKMDKLLKKHDSIKEKLIGVFRRIESDTILAKRYEKELLDVARKLQKRESR